MNTKTTSHPLARYRFRPFPGRTAPLFLVIAVLLAMAVHASATITWSPLAGNTISSGESPGTALTNAKAEPPDIFQPVSALSQGLRCPDGIARDAESGDIYVSMEGGPAIIRIKVDGSREVLFDSSTPLYEGSGTTRKRVTGLRSPEGLALDGQGGLYVVEDLPGGRLISFNLMGLSTNLNPCGTVVPIPFENNCFAWESVDVGPAGELLVAGSSMEFFASEFEKEGAASLFQGAILYRDAQGEWWVPLLHALASYSAACFSLDGNQAFFACEFSGDVGCLNLRSKLLRTYHADHTFQSPEGLCALPDGSALVTEESGKIYCLDPAADTLQLLYDFESTIESVFWDGLQRRLLVADDQRGTLWSMEVKADEDFHPAFGMPRDILYEEQSVVVELIPDQCPDYLASILKLSGYDPAPEGGNLSFRDFARQFSLVAIDADVLPLSLANPGEDPITRLQFVIVAPSLMGVRGGELFWSSSGFVAIKQSGQVVKTTMVERQVIQGDLMECRFTPMGGQQIALPMPISTRINTDGIATIHFVGMGVMPDYLLILNTILPEQSFLLVLQPGERPKQYSVFPPPHRDPNSWVVALERKEPVFWRSLSFNP